MHVDWNWIRQRPQHLAEELDREFDVLVLYAFSVRRGRLTPNPSPVRRLPLAMLPGRRKRAVRLVNRIVGPVAVALVEVAFRPDHVLLTSPDLLDVLPPWSRVPVHYDCMDLAEGFAADEAHGAWIRQSEQRLVRRARSISVSSERLGDHVVSLGATVERVHLVRNGVGALTPLPPRSARSGPGVDLGYVGTISDWLDVALLEEACRAIPHLRWHFWGPAAVALPDHPRFVYHGVVARHELPPLLAFLDGFVMPFKVSPLITAVDPVKLYEYLAWDRPVIAVAYPEVEPFRPYVAFYSDPVGFLERIRELEAGGLRPEREVVLEFLRASTWSARARVLAAAITWNDPAPRQLETE